jgi:hypothetical protein
MAKPKKTLAERIVDADCFASKNLADGNWHKEHGRDDKANECYGKAQYWKDRWVYLSGHGDKAPPRD